MSNVRFSPAGSGITPVVKNLIIINFLVYAAQTLLDKQYAITQKLMMYPLLPEKLGQMVAEANADWFEKFQPYQVATHMFTHMPINARDGILHIIFNMFGLWMFGRVLETIWGAKRFLWFYFACGLGAAALHLGIQYFRGEMLLRAIEANNLAGIARNSGAISPVLGASGAIMGVLIAVALYFPNTELIIFPIPVPVKLKWVAVAYVLIDLFSGIGVVKGDKVANFAHLGGAITGFIIVWIWNKTNRRTLY